MYGTVTSRVIFCACALILKSWSLSFDVDIGSPSKDRLQTVPVLDGRRHELHFQLLKMSCQSFCDSSWRKRASHYDWLWWLSGCQITNWLLKFSWCDWWPSNSAQCAAEGSSIMFTLFTQVWSPWSSEGALCRRGRSLQRGSKVSLVVLRVGSFWWSSIFTLIAFFNFMLAVLVWVQVCGRCGQNISKLESFSGRHKLFQEV